MGICHSRIQKNVYISIDERLRSITREHLTDFTYENISTVAKVVSVYDGDTCRIAFGYPSNDDDAEIIMLSCRLNGIDTPEIRNKNLEEKQLAIEARDYLKEMVMNDGQLVYVVFYKNDKYGRPLVDIYIDEMLRHCVNDKLIDSGYAKLYNGGKKI